MTTTTEVLRYTAFAETPFGGNPAGVVLNASKLTDTEMHRIATEVGYSETAFVVSTPNERNKGLSEEETDQRSYHLRYWSPAAEVPFCGHASVATAVALAERDGTGSLLFHTLAGEIPIMTSRSATGQIEVAMTSVEPRIRDFAPSVLDSLLNLLGLEAADIDPRFPPKEVFAGNWHPILVLGDESIFNQFRFSPPAVAALMNAQGWTGTVTALHEISPGDFQARNLFPVGRITEDPATGSAAASTGAYLRFIDYSSDNSTVIIHQGMHVGRPSVLTAIIPAKGGITVLGTATQSSLTR